MTEATCTITVIEGYDAMAIFLDTVWRRHGRSVEEIALLLGSLKWADGSPVDPTTWQDWLAAVQMAASAGRCKIGAGRCSGGCGGRARACALTNRYSIANGVGSVGAGNARSSAARSSLVRRSAEAAWFSRTCATLAAFGIATTPSCRSSQA